MIKGLGRQVISDEDTHLFPEMTHILTKDPPKGQCPLAPVLDRHWLTMSLTQCDILSLRPTAGLSSRREYESSSEGPSITNFIFLSAKARPLCGATGNLRVEATWPVDSLPNHTKSKAKQRDWPHFHATVSSFAVALSDNILHDQSSRGQHRTTLWEEDTASEREKNKKTH